MRHRPLLALLLLAALALAAPSSARAVELGLNMNGGAAAGTPDNFTQISDSGAHWARHFVVWNGSDQIDGGYDGIVAREQAMGVKTLFVVTGIGGIKPTDPQVYARFVGRLAERYRGRVDAYEVWNEEDESGFWPGGGDPAAYVALLRAAHRTIKAADPAATVVFGPLVANHYDFVEQAYAAGAKGLFDAMAVHTDTACLINSPTDFYRDHGRVARFTFLGYREVRATMLAHDDDKPIWMTEFGWSATRDTCTRGMWAGKKDAGVPEEQQARFLREAYHCMSQDPYLQVAMWFNSRDLRGDGSELESYGLRRFDGSNRPAAAAFRDVAAGHDTVSGSCGDFSAPDVSFASPLPGTKYSGKDMLDIRFASRDADIVRLDLTYDGGTLVRHFGNGGKPIDFDHAAPAMTWFGSRKLALGAHKLTVTAYDAQGNAGSASVDVERVAPGALPAQKVVFGPLRLGGRGLVRTLSGGVVAGARATGIAGKVRVEWQLRRGGRWKRMHGAGKYASRPFRFVQRLRSPGRWRVRVKYVGARPYRSTSSPWRTFTAR